MSEYFVKDPIDCSDAELTKFLTSKGVEDPKGLRKSDKVRFAQTILRTQNRNTIMFKAPSKGFIERGIFKARKWLSKNEQASIPEVGDLITLNLDSPNPSAPSVVSSTGYNNYLQAMNNLSMKKSTLPVFSPSSVPAISDSLSQVAHYDCSHPGSDMDQELEHENLLVEKKSAPRRPPAPAPRKNLTKKVDISKPEGDRGGGDHLYQSSPIDFPRSSPNERTKQNISGQKQEKNTLLTNDQTAYVTRDNNKYKFDLKFDTNSVSIEDFLKALNRWRVANQASDEKAINQGLQNFKNVSLANNIIETLSPEGQYNFEVFYGEMMDKLGKSRREWYRTFQKDIRNKNESCVEFFGKLCSHLKHGLGTNELNEVEQNQVTEKFLEAVHPDLRGFLVIREPEVSFHDVAQVAQKIELARNIPRCKPAMINNVMPTKSGDFPKSENNYKGATKNFPKKKFGPCTLCNKEGHSLPFCYGNAAGERFNLEKFHAAKKTGNKDSQALN